MSRDCAFCSIVTGNAPAKIVHRWPDAVAFEPLNPVTPGHVLVVPCRHVAHALIDPVVTGLTMRRSAELASHPCNLLTSVGEIATQTVHHLHIHVVPRRPGDGLLLPWTEVHR